METKKIFILGGPKVGKTTLARHMALAEGLPLKHCDDLISLGWQAVSNFIVENWMKEDSFLIEGCAGVRALRKFISRNPGVQPCDRVIILREALEPRSKGQEGLAKGVETVYNDIEEDLATMGVEVIECDSREEAMEMYS